MKEEGKDICQQLKEIRRQVADDNNIPLEQPECTYEGPCDGTCPHCEAEVQYLEQELERRRENGEPTSESNSFKAKLRPGKRTAGMPIRDTLVGEISYIDGSPEKEADKPAKGIKGLLGKCLRIFKTNKKHK